MPEKRGISISLAYRSWRLICEVLSHVVENPYLDDLEECHEEIGTLLRYIKGKLKEER